MINTKELIEILNQQLKPERFSDYCPNGLQIEGTPYITRIATAVSTNEYTIHQAISQQADVLLVHHGLFWKGENPTLTGIRKQRIAALLKADINLIAYHLPLDAHPELGNNVQLAKKLGWPLTGFSEKNQLLAYTDFDQPIDASDLFHQLQTHLGRAPQFFGKIQPEIRRVVLCTGAAQDYLEQAHDMDAQVYISGEISERTVAQAQEMGMLYIAAGHYATEQFGVQALGKWLDQHHKTTSFFIPENNPV
jgi:dinuclear metal center YbgI/SA1388 family protein